VLSDRQADAISDKINEQKSMRIKNSKGGNNCVRSKCMIRTAIVDYE
jgi:hypothetical protein